LHYSKNTFSFGHIPAGFDNSMLTKVMNSLAENKTEIRNISFFTVPVRKLVFV